MKKSVKVNVYFLMQILIFSSMVLASIEVGQNQSSSLKLIYGESETLSGWLNLSIKDEDSSLKVTDSFGNKIGLSDLILLNEQKGYIGSSNYYCNIKNCSQSYTTTEAFESKTFDLTFGERKTIGLKVSGRDLSVESVEFTLESDASSSCFNQIYLNFGEGLVKTANYKSSQSSCPASLSYGCFDDSIEKLNFNLLEENMYCQKISLGEYPGFKIGAWIQKINGTDNVTMILQNNLTSEVASCNIPNSELSLSGSEVGCQVNYPLNSQADYFVCIKKSGNTGIIKIPGYGEGASNYCGYFTQGSYKQLTQSYKIFAEAKQYDSLGEMRIYNNLTSTPLSSVYNNYISKVYSNKNCTSGCILPIEIISNANQKITLKNLSVSFKHSAGQTDPEKKFYEIEKDSSKISTNDFTKIYFDPANFFVLDESGNESLIIKIGDEEVYEGQIEIQKTPKIKYLYPLNTASAYPTEFIVEANASSGTISSYLWNFEDDKLNKTTTENKIIHTFNETGNYSVYLQIRDSSGRTSSKTFEVIVTSPEEVIANKYSELKSRVANLQTQINTYPSFFKNQISNAINIEDINIRLERYKSAKLSADTLSEKNEVLTLLLNLSSSVPKYIKITYQIKNLTYFPKESKIDLEVIKEITGGNYETGEEEKYRQAIISWQEENVDMKLDYTQISGEFDSGVKKILSHFIVNTEKKNEIYPPYFILKNMSNLKFEPESASYVLTSNGYSYIKIPNQKQKIEFSTIEDVTFLDLPMFISPELSYLNIQEELNPTEPEENMKWGLFILMIIFILTLAVIAYIFLQEWYRNKYEDHLFKGKNNMYNLITYIESQKKQGIENGIIEKKLKNAGWNGEQVSYVMKKYHGKRTGMIELPFSSIFRKDKTKQQSSQNNLNSQYPRIDTRFKRG